MRPIVLLGLLSLAACDDSGVVYVGPGVPQPNNSTNNPTNSTGSGTQAGSYSCDLRQRNGSCILFTGDGWDQSSMEGSCDGNFSRTGCPPSDLGGCTLTPDEALETIVWYYQGSYYADDDAVFLQAECEVNQGLWR